MTRPTAVGAHIYAGGFTEGMRHHLDVLGHLEVGNFGVETAKLNLKNLEIRIDPELKTQSFGKADIFYSNPPCVAWSRLGHREYESHPTVNDMWACVRLGKETQCKIFIWECVPQVWSQGQELVKQVAKEWNDLGYHVTVFLTDANLHGINQRRHRYHFIASKLKLNLYLPDESKWGEACGELLKTLKPEIDPKNLHVRRYLQWMEPYAVPGYPLRKIWLLLHGVKQKPEGLRFCPPFCIQRLDGEKPSCTLTGGPDFIHPYEWRVLSPGEMGILSGFPVSWKWLGHVVDRYKQVAKGVTPAMGDYLGEVCARAVEQDQGVEGCGLEVIDYRPHSDAHWPKGPSYRYPKELENIAENNQVKPEFKTLTLEQLVKKEHAPC